MKHPEQEMEERAHDVPTESREDQEEQLSSTGQEGQEASHEASEGLSHPISNQINHGKRKVSEESGAVANEVESTKRSRLEEETSRAMETTSPVPLHTIPHPLESTSKSFQDRKPTSTPGSLEVDESAPAP
jgi:hypothetical protein